MNLFACGLSISGQETVNKRESEDPEASSGCLHINGTNPPESLDLMNNL